MQFSQKIIDLYKEHKGYSQDKQIIADLDGMNSGNFTKVRKGERHLSAKHVIFMANEIGLDWKEALLELAVEKAKSKEELDAWKELKKKITAACVAIAMTIASAAVMTGAVPPRRIRNSL